MDNNTALELKNISKQYPGVLALDNMSIAFRKGEIHALLGENGAGKSTLIKVCTGAIRPSSGTIETGGRQFSYMTPQLSEQNGVAVVYQELNLVDELSVAENIYLGQKMGGKHLFNKAVIEKKAKELLENLGMNIPATAKIKELSPGYQQLVEIAKALSLDARILILDEPSAALTDTEVQKLFKTILKMKAMGTTVIYISHRLDELFQIVDRVTVLRDGRKIETLNVKDTNKDMLISLMVGRKMTEVYPKYEGNPGGEVILEVNHLSGNGLKDISFQVRKGEILGLGGLVGAGRTELAQILFGVVKKESGEIRIHNREVQMNSPTEAIGHGLALVPEDRKQQGLILKMSIERNISLASLKRMSKGTVINRRTERNTARNYAGALKLKAAGLEYDADTLSGGNQQKIVLAKWMATEPEIVILDEPTRGVDVGAKYEIYLLMHEMLRAGKTLIMISSEMEELINMSDRIVVLSEGRQTGELKKAEFDQEKILKYASGADIKEDG